MVFKQPTFYGEPYEPETGADKEAALEEAVANALAVAGGVDAADVKVTLEDHAVVLTGVVATAAESERARLRHRQQKLRHRMCIPLGACTRKRRRGVAPPNLVARSRGSLHPRMRAIESSVSRHTTLGGHQKIKLCGRWPELFIEPLCFGFLQAIFPGKLTETIRSPAQHFSGGR